MSWLLQRASRTAVLAVTPRCPCDRILPVLGPQRDIVQHMRALPHRDVAAAVETVRVSAAAAPAVKLAFEFLALTKPPQFMYD